MAVEAVVLAAALASPEPLAAVALAVALLVQEVDAFAIHLSLLPCLPLVELLVVQH